MARQLALLSKDCKLVLVYGFASSGDIKSLRDRGVQCLRAPVESNELLRIVKETGVRESRSTQEESLGEVPSRRLPDDVIARVSGILPSIQ